MTLESEIHKKTGVRINGIPDDGKSRSFKVGHKEWFAIKLPGCGSFGCFSTGEVYGWSGGKSWPIAMLKKDLKLNARRIREEVKIIDIGNSLMDAGWPMSEEDLDRYICALGRVAQWQQDNKGLAI